MAPVKGMQRQRGEGYKLVGQYKRNETLSGVVFQWMNTQPTWLFELSDLLEEEDVPFPVTKKIRSDLIFLL